MYKENSISTSFKTKKIPFVLYFEQEKEDADLFLFMKNFMHKFYVKFIWCASKEGEKPPEPNFEVEKHL